jgi:hypothetical protein
VLLAALLAAGCAAHPSAWRGPEAEIERAWLRHLAAKEGRYSWTAGQPSEDWLPEEQREWRVYDLASLYLPDGATPEVLSIRRGPGPLGEYRVVTAFRTPTDQNAMRAKVVRMTVFARRVGDRWLFGNALPRLTSGWRRERVGPITYVVEPGQPFDRVRATRAATFIDSLATALAVPRLDQVTYVLTSSEDELYRVLGLETDRKWGPVGGLAQPVNRLVLSGIPAQGENYRHELAHLVIMPLLLGHPTPYVVSEGVPTWLGGTTGMDFPTAARGLARFLAEHPGVTLDTLLTRPFPVAQFYPAGAVLVDLAYRDGGTEGVKALFDAGPTPAELRVALARRFRRPWPVIAAAWRAHALSFLPKGDPDGDAREEHDLPLVRP